MAFIKKPIPFLISGSGGGGGKGSHTATEAANTLRSTSYAQIIDLISEGEIEGVVGGGQGIYLNGVPLQNSDGTYNFTGLTVETRNGALSQSRLSMSTTAEDTVSVATQLRCGVPITASISDLNVDTCRVTVSVPQLTYQDSSSGDINGASVSFTVQYKGTDTAWLDAPVAMTTSSTTSTGITGTTYIYGSLVCVSGSAMKYYSNKWTDGNVSVTAPTTFYVQVQVNGGAWTTILSQKVTGTQSVPFSLAASPSSVYNFRYYWDTPEWPAGSNTPTGPSAGFNYFSKAVSTNVITISGKCTSTYEKQISFALTGTGPWSVRLTRTTADSTQSNLINNIYFESITSVITDKLAYPGSALVGLSVDATQFSSIPTRAYDTKLLKVQVPANYDPVARTYTGIWNGAWKMAWTDNPAWCWRDMVVNDRYGLGDRFNDGTVDKWSLYQIAQYCDELVPDGYGGTEPRFTCNLYLQKQEEAYKVLSDMAGIFRGIIYWGALGAIPVQDSPKDAVYQYTDSNVIDGQFNYQSSNVSTKYNAVTVSWIDNNQLGKKQYEYVEDVDLINSMGYLNQTSVEGFGLASRGQARRLGKWLLYTNSMEIDSVTFGVGWDGEIPMPGDVINIADPLRAGQRWGGRVMGGDTSTIILDNVLTFDSSVTYTLTLVNTLGGLESRTLAPIKGSSNTVTTTTPFGNSPSKNSIYVISSAVLAPQTFRVISITEKEAGQYAISAVSYNKSKYDFIEDGLPLETANITTISRGPCSVPVNVVCSDNIYVTSAKNIASEITVTWDACTNARGYVVSYRTLNGNWMSLNEVQGTNAAILNTTDLAQYEIEVQSVNPFGVMSQPSASVFYTPQGKTRPPQDVSSLSYSADSGVGVSLNWTAVTDVDLDCYEVRVGSTWDSAAVVSTINATSLAIGYISSATYLVKAKDTSGNYSTNAASVYIQLSGPSTPVVTSTFSGGNVTLSWAPSTGPFYTDYYTITGAGVTSVQASGTSITLPVNWFGSNTLSVVATDAAGNSSNAGTCVVAVQSAPAPVLQYTISGQNILLNWTAVQGSLTTASYNIYSNGTLIANLSAMNYSQKVSFLSNTFSVCAVDVAGNIGATGSVVAQINVPTQPTITSQVIDNNVLLKWTDSTNTLPIGSYKVLRGATYATATVVGNVQGSFATIFESQGGTYTYWVVGVDTAGNAGTPGSVGVTVSQPPDYLLRYNQNSAFGGTFSNALYDTVQQAVMLPVNNTETFQQHFSSRSWNSAQAQITAGFPFYLQPTLSPGYYEEVFDYGTILAGTKITVTPTYTVTAGTPTIFSTISVKTNSTDVWTDYVGVTSVFATNFRYVKVRVTVTNADTVGLVSMTNLNVTLDEKLKNDAGTATVSASDSSGTSVAFNTSFVNVTAITVSPVGTTPAYAIYNFSGVANPTNFQIYLYNTSGNRISGTVAWTAKGV